MKSLCFWGGLAAILLAGQPFAAAQTAPGNNGAPSSQVQVEAGALISQRAEHKTDLFTGSFGYSVPIAGAPGRGGSEPALALVYSSSGDNGWCGLGWVLDIGYIERNTKDGFPMLYDASSPPLPLKQYDPAKGFILNLFGKQMKLLTNSASEYRAEVDKDFLRCQFDTANNRWDVFDKSGTVYRFGYTNRVLNPNSGWTANYTGTFRWALEEIITATGERTTITYQTHSTSDVGTARMLYPDIVAYNGHTNWNGYAANQTPTHTIQFGLQPRTDTRISYRSGFRVVQDMRLTNIVCQANGQNVRRYALEYDYSPATKRSLLARIRTFGADDTSELPAQSFAYQNKPLTFAPKVKWKDISVATPSITERDIYGNAFTDLIDMDGDGLPDRVRWDSSTTPDRYFVQRNLGLAASGTEGAFATNESSFGPTSAANFPEGFQNNQAWAGLNSSRVRIMDVNGDGKPDRVGDDSTYMLNATPPYNHFGVQINSGSGFNADQSWPVDTQSSSYYYAIDTLTDTISAGRTSLLDINGDGIPDRVMMALSAPWNYFYVQFGTGAGFSPIRCFGPLTSQGKTSSVIWSGVESSWVHMVDINGDGLLDRVMLPLGSNPGFPDNPVQDASLTNFVVEFNNGYGFEPQVWPGVYPQYVQNPVNVTHNEYTYVQKFPDVGLLDLNGDGLPDRVMPKELDNNKTTWLFYRNTGTGFDTVSNEISGIDIQNAVNANNENWFGLQGVGDSRMNYVNGHTITAMLDMNGDGLLDRVMADYTYANNPFGTPFYGLWVQTNSGPFPDLLMAVSNGIGGTLAVTYKPSTTWDNRQDPTDANSGKLLPFPIQTVSSLTENDGVNTNRTTTYLYSGGFYDGSRHEFAGFAKVTETDASNRQQVYYYHQGGGQDRMALGGYVDASTNLARFNQPGGVTWDSSGNLYVSDTANHVIRKITPAGVVTTIAGSPGQAGVTNAAGTAARFNHPTGILYTGGYLYVADTDNHSIRLINLTGNVVTTFAGSNGVAGSVDNNPFSGARFYRPTSLAFNVAGTELYVADTGNHTIRKLSGAGMTTIGGVGIPGTTDNPPRFNHPSGLTLDGGNNLFIADTDNHTIRQRTAAGVVSTLAGSSGVAGSADSTSYLNARFRSPSAVALSADFQTIYVADTGNQTIRKLVASGVTTVAGRVGNSGNVDGIGTNAFFNSLASLTVDGSGNVFIADTGNNLIRKATPSGSFLAVTNFVGGVDTYGEYADSGSFAKRGMPYRIEAYGNDANLYSVVVNQVDQFSLGNGRWFPFVQQTFNFDYPGGGTPRITATRFAYNLSNGNLTNQIAFGEVANVNLTSLSAPTDVDASDTQYHHTSYAALSNTNILNLPDTIKLTSDAAGSTVIQEQKFTYNANSGTVATELNRICAGSYATNRFEEYDDYGLPTLTISPVGVQTKITAFDALHIYPTVARLRVTAGSDLAGDHITTTANDVRSGAVTDVTDPMGVLVHNTYDTFFRLTQTDKTPVGGAAVWVKQISYGPFAVITAGNAVNYVHAKLNDGVDAVNGVESRTYFDGWGRPLQTRTEAEAGNYRVVSTAYDERGEAFLTTWPRFESGVAFVKPTAQPGFFTGYDAAGRVAQTQTRVEATFNTNGAFVNKTDSTGDANSPLAPRLMAYTNGIDPWWRITTDEDGKVRRYQLDAFGRNKQIQEVDGANTYLTSFKYDLAGNLTHITNHVGEVISYGHDDLGNVVAMADPHLGYWIYHRDAAGRVREQIDGKGQKIAFTFAATLSRLSLKQVYNAATQLVAAATYSYDSGDINHTVYKGQLFQVTDSEGSEKSGYDTRGRRIRTTRHLNLNNQDYVTRFTFNDGDRVASIIYPNSGPTITNEYHAGGSLKRVGRSSYDYYAANAANFDAFGRVLQFSFGNSTTTTRSNYPTSQRLYSLSVPGVFARDYRYSAGEDVTYLNGSGLAPTTVTYDNLHRIKTYTGLPGSGYAYDPVGNITNSIESGTASSYGYGNARKQAVKSAFGKNYLYDKCGNMIVRNGGTTNSQALEYNAENRLVRFSEVGRTAVEYGYADSGARLWRRSYVTGTNSPKLQIWIGNLYEEKDGKTLFHVFAGGQRICTYERDSILNGGSGTSTNYVGYFYHQDHLGSSSVLSDYAGNLKELSVWYPFGRTQTNNPTAAFKVSNKFTGQVQDEETGLYYYNARYYDPELGRFIQADTIIPDPANPQSYNRYAYVLNNPLRYTDPTGFEPDDLDDIPLTMGAAHAAMRQSAGGESARLYDKNVNSAHMMAGGLRAGMEMNPVVGTFNGAYGAIKGKDAVDYHELTGVERVKSGAGAVLSAAPVALKVEAGIIQAGKEVSAGMKIAGATAKVEKATAQGFQAFKSFDALKRALGPAGEGRVWHHVVEQRAANIEKFGAEAIHNTENVVNASRQLNQKIADYYSTKQAFSGGKTVREWLNPQTYQQQREFGIKVMNEIKATMKE
ncbi:MAG: pre-toxin TG domain-containing protein [Verrucomicrobiae bacterium]|nr:pre-toxin TG domain-containing protein [Verrucomicrobiae bacterium]